MEKGIISTIGQKCKRCYSCVRECPAKAIQVMDGQAFVLSERCISCGHCVKVCSQNAKEIESDKERVLFDIIPKGNAVAIIAPSFPASFSEQSGKFLSALREIGFNKVCEASFGADLTSPLYRQYFEEDDSKTIISSPCPAIYNFIEKYYENLVPNLAKIVSPMIAMGRYVKENMGSDTEVVFIGPCIAKKSEYKDEQVKDAIDAVLTFSEVKEIFGELDINLNALEDMGFDPPYSYMGKSFAIAGGLLKTAEITNDILEKEVIVVEGVKNVEEIIKDLSEDTINSKFIDILFCEGCINGPAVDSNLNYYSKREKVLTYVNKFIHTIDKNVWKSEKFNSRDLDLHREFESKCQRRPMPEENEIQEILAKTNKFTKEDELNCGACGYKTCREYAIAISKNLAEEEMCLPYLIDNLELAYKELQETQDQLHNVEKLASIGQLAAGVAHEINNPLGTIMLYASMLKKNIDKQMDDTQSAEDLKLIIEEANRCKAIVSNLLNFARHGKLKISNFSISTVIDDVIKTAKLKYTDESVGIEITNNVLNPEIAGDRDQIKQVLINIINNAFEAMEESEKQNIQIAMNEVENKICIEITDSGCGISKENLKKMFTPFFTTKQMGKGTGLGLAISYGIIKMHKGDISVSSTDNTGTTFKIKLPTTIKNNNGILN